MTTVTAVLLKPLDGDAEGTEREFDQPDFDALEKMGAVRAASAVPAKVPLTVEEKAAPVVLNKRAPAVMNKAVEG